MYSTYTLGAYMCNRMCACVCVFKRECVERKSTNKREKTLQLEQNAESNKSK